MSKTMITPSEPTNNLIELASRLLAGEDVAETLDRALAAQMRLVESEIEQVPLRAKKLGEDFIEEIGVLYNALIDHMYLYHEGLAELAVFFDAENPNPENLEAGIRILTEITGDLVALQTSYGQAYSSYGPSRFPLVNAVDRVLTGFREDPQVEEELLRVLDMMRQTLQRTLEGVNEKDPGGDEVKEGAEKAIDTLEKIKDQYRDHATHEPNIKALGEALFDLETGDEEQRLSMLDGPSCMPAANIFINTARKALAQGKNPKERIQIAHQTYVQHVAENWDTIEAQLERPIDSAAIQEELPKTMEVVDQHEELMERIEEILEEGCDPEELEECLVQLVDVVEVFRESAQVYVDAAGRVGKLVCVSCGRGNPRANRVCEACGQSLPKIVDDEYSNSTFQLSEHGGIEDETKMVMTTNIARIFQACQDIMEQKIAPAEFESTLAWAHGLLNEMSKGVVKLQLEIQQLAQSSEDTPETQAEISQLSEVVAFMEEGIDEWAAGLDEMARYLDEPEIRHLNSGKRRVWEGASAVHRCRVIGDTAKEMLEQPDLDQAQLSSPS